MSSMTEFYAFLQRPKKTLSQHFEKEEEEQKTITRIISGLADVEVDADADADVGVDDARSIQSLRDAKMTINGENLSILFFVTTR